MYPLNEAQPYPFRQWWMIAYSWEVTRSILGRTILGERVVLYRTNAGEAIVMSGICPHRMYPMEKGQLVGDSIQCGYHGIRYDKSGRCDLVPTQKSAVPASLRRYPVAEIGGSIWVWTGESELADPGLMPPLARMGIGADGWKVVETDGPIHLEGRYTLLIDNLLDLSHATFIHSDTIPGAELLAKLPCEVLKDDKSYNNRRVARNIPSNPFIRALFPDFDGMMDEQFDAEYFGPGLVRTGGDFLVSGTDRRLGTVNFVHIMTPETPGTTHYFISTTRDIRLDDPAIDGLFLDQNKYTGPQDTAAIASIERVLQSGSALPQEISVRADVGSIQVRRILAAQIRAEVESKRSGSTAL